MAEPAGALANPSGPGRSLSGAPIIGGYITIGNDVEDNVVRMSRVRNALHAIEGVKPKRVADLPGHHMVSAGGVSTDAEPADSDSVLIERKSTAKHVHAADAIADHRISLRAEILGAALALLETGLAQSGLTIAIAVGDLCVDWVAVLQAVEAAARLHCREQVGSRQGEAGAFNSASRRRAAFA